MNEITQVGPEETISINEAANQLRMFISKKNQEKFHKIGSLPEMDGTMGAAGWLRRNGSAHFTNLSFRGLLSDMVGRLALEEESHIARVSTGISVYLELDMSCSIFVTSEEIEHIEYLVNNGEIPKENIVITKTVLGGYVQLYPQ